MRKSNKLQILTEAGWEYVFCWNLSTGLVVTTKTKRKALPGSDLEYFRNKTSNEYRIV